MRVSRRVRVRALTHGKWKVLNDENIQMRTLHSDRVWQWGGSPRCVTLHMGFAPDIFDEDIERAGFDIPLNTDGHTPASIDAFTLALAIELQREYDAGTLTREVAVELVDVLRIEYLEPIGKDGTNE